MSVKKSTIKVLATAAVAGLMSTAAMAEDTVKIGYIDPLSGPFSAVGQGGLLQFQFAADYFANNQGGVLGKKLEVIGFDNKVSPKESLIQLKNAIGQGVRYVVQGNGSSVAHALTGQISKYNKRNPGKEILFLNYSAVDPALTEEKCSYWHFRFDANADMKMSAITDVIKDRKDIKKIYIIGQDYSFGKAVSAAAKRFLKEKRPDIEIVGDELHPIGKVKDFTPYISKISASGADAVITGNWGADMVNLARAAQSGGLKADFFTYYAAGTGITAAIGEGGVGHIRLVADGHANPTRTAVWDAYNEAFKAKHPDTDLNQARIAHTIQYLIKAMKQANSTEPKDVAKALEGMEVTTLAGDKLVMRAQDHQLQMPLQIMVHTKGVKWDYDKSGYGLQTEASVPLEANTLPTSCNMDNRPK